MQCPEDTALALQGQAPKQKVSILETSPSRNCSARWKFRIALKLGAPRKIRGDRGIGKTGATFKEWRRLARDTKL
jgi:hypothetical protein